MIKMKNLNLDVNAGEVIYINIDIFKFSFDKDFNDLKVEIEINGEYEFLEELELAELEVIADHQDLKRVALNWLFKNVEIVKVI